MTLRERFEFLGTIAAVVVIAVAGWYIVFAAAVWVGGLL